jgi:hypothetical protein
VGADFFLYYDKRSDALTAGRYQTSRAPKSNSHGNSSDSLSPWLFAPKYPGRLHSNDNGASPLAKLKWVW